MYRNPGNALMSAHPSGPHRMATRHNKRDMQSPGRQHWRDAWLKISGLTQTGRDELSWTVLRSSGTLRDCNLRQPFPPPNKWQFYWWPHIVCHEVSISIQYLKQLFLYPPGLCLAALVTGSFWEVRPSACFLILANSKLLRTCKNRRHLY